MKAYYILPFLLLGAGQANAQRMQMTPEQRTQRLKDSLALSDDQVKGIVKIYEDVDKQRKDLPGDRQKRMEVMRALMDSSDVKIEAILTAPQEEKYEAIKKQRQERQQNYRRRE